MTPYDLYKYVMISLYIRSYLLFSSSDIMEMFCFALNSIVCFLKRTTDCLLDVFLIYLSVCNICCYFLLRHCKIKKR